MKLVMYHILRECRLRMVTDRQMGNVDPTQSTKDTAQSKRVFESEDIVCLGLRPFCLEGGSSSWRGLERHGQ